MTTSPLADLIGRQRTDMRDAIAIRFWGKDTANVTELADAALDAILDVLNEQGQLTDGERRHLDESGGALPTEHDRKVIDAYDTLNDAVRDVEGGDGSTPWALVFGSFPAEARVITAHRLDPFAAMGLLSTGVKIAEQGRAEA